MNQDNLYQRMREMIQGYRRVCLSKDRSSPMVSWDMHQKKLHSLFNLWSASQSKFKQAAVLVPCFFKGGVLSLLLTRRTQKLEHHKGEISFPGGAYDLLDESLETTALRETQEEIGLPPEAVHMLGVIDDVFTLVSGFVVTPYVGFIPYPYEWIVNPLEIDEILEIPLSFFFYEENYREGSFWYQDKEVPSYFFEWRKDVIIWGLTANIIKNLCRILQKNIPEHILQSILGKKKSSLLYV